MKTKTIPARELVVGDTVLIDSGERAKIKKIKRMGIGVKLELNGKVAKGILIDYTNGEWSIVHPAQKVEVL